jgi:peroxiredoxin
MAGEIAMKHALLSAWLWLSAIMVTLLILPEAGRCGGPPKKGDVLPAIQLNAPGRESDQQYLGIKGPMFRSKDVAGRILLIEIIGVYCPHCYKQAPLFRNLFNRLETGKLAGKVKMLGIAAGGTLEELEYLREQGQYNYPLVGDESYKVHKLLGEPNTPFTMLVDKQGKVLYEHLGVIEDMEGFYDEIQKLAE